MSLFHAQWSYNPLCLVISVVDIKFKVWSLLAQWVKRFASSPSGWVSFMSFWFRSYPDASLLEVLSDPFS